MNINDFKSGSKFTANIESVPSGSIERGEFEVTNTNVKSNTIYAIMTPPVDNISEVVLQIKHRNSVIGAGTKFTPGYIIDANFRRRVTNLELV